MSEEFPLEPSDVSGQADPGRKQSSFAGDVTRLASGAGVAQLIAILSAPILTRLYAPEAFGVAALFLAVTSIIGVIACMRYELAIVLPERDDEAANLLVVSLCFPVLVSALTVLLVWLGGSYVLHAANLPELVPYLWLVPVAVLVHGVFTALNYWYTRTKYFTRQSLSRVMSSTINATGALGAGFFGHATAGAKIAAGIAGQGVATILLGGTMWRDNGRFLRDHVTWRGMWEGIKRHRKFPLYSTWSAWLNTLSWMLPVFMLGAFFPPEIVGFYALGFRMLQMPMSLIGNAIAQVFFQRAAQARLEGTLDKLVEEVFHRLVMAGLFPMLMLSMIGRDVYVVIFGGNWAEAGVYTQILAVWAFFWFISSPLSTLFSVLEKQELGLKLNVCLLLTRFGSLAIGGYSGDARLALYLFSGTGVLVYGYLGGATMLSAGVKKRRIWAILGRGITWFIPFGVIMFGLLLAGSSRLTVLGMAVGLSGVYVLALWRFQPELFTPWCNRTGFDHTKEGRPS